MGAHFSKLTKAYVQFWNKLGVSIDDEFGIVGFGSILRCSVLSFLAYFLPLAAMRRKLRDPHHTRAALAFGAFSFTYRTSRLLIARLVPERNVDVHIQAPFLAGAAGAATTCVIDPSFVSSLFLIWWSLRALRTLEKVQLFDKTPWGPPALMCASAEFLAPAALYTTQDHHVSYQKFLQPFWEAAGDTLEKFRKDPRSAFATDGKGVMDWWIRYTYGVVAQTVRVYLPLHGIWALFRLPAYTPVSLIVKNTATSCLFLSSYVLSLMALLQANSALVGGIPPRWHVHLWAWLSGFSVLLERSNRQAELSWFCAAHAVNCIYNHLKRRGWVKENLPIGMIFAMFATGLIMKHNAERPGRTMHLLFGELKGRRSQLLSQKKSTPLLSRRRLDGGDGVAEEK